MEKTLNLSDVLDEIQRNKNVILSFGVKNIGVFGSFVKNEQKISSDLDILIEFKKGMKSFDNYMGLLFFLEDLFQVKIDLVIKEAIKPRLKSHILESVTYAKGL
ncbi:MAG: nucleotidyltransferase family protein [Asgard group archaeon]|nr:nucleotidyltransferase family protein [Asgard group archaeon]